MKFWDQPGDTAINFLVFPWLRSLWSTSHYNDVQKLYFFTTLKGTHLYDSSLSAAHKKATLSNIKALDLLLQDLAHAGLPEFILYNVATCWECCAGFVQTNFYNFYISQLFCPPIYIYMYTYTVYISFCFCYNRDTPSVYGSCWYYILLHSINKFSVQRYPVNSCWG